MRKIVQIEDIVKKEFPSLDISSLQIDRFSEYFILLSQWNKRINLTAIRNLEEMLFKHLIDALVFYKIAEKYPKLINREIKSMDFGSGAGIPGIILAIAGFLNNLVSVDKSKKKIAFQQEVVRKLKLSSVLPLHERLEDLIQQNQYKNSFGLIITRAFSQIKDILSFADPFLCTKGCLVLWKGEKWRDEIENISSTQKKKYELLDTFSYTISHYQLGGTLLLIQKTENK